MGSDRGEPTDRFLAELNRVIVAMARVASIRRGRSPADAEHTGGRAGITCVSPLHAFSLLCVSILFCERTLVRHARHTISTRHPSRGASGSRSDTPLPTSPLHVLRLPLTLPLPFTTPVSSSLPLRCAAGPRTTRHAMISSSDSRTNCRHRTSVACQADIRRAQKMHAPPRRAQ